MRVMNFSQKEPELYSPGDLQSQGAASGVQPFDYEGATFMPGARSHWKANYPDGMRRLLWAGRLHVAKGSIRYRRFADDFPWQARTNFWSDTGTGGFTNDKFYVVADGHEGCSNAAC